ncbi:IS110 family transposase [Caballeronia sp. LZ035]|uniref:IS110 family transposase n=1 Tax=Caballeronia sp. LZ035 TaxID=3038568 RepID=UPI00285E7771|nr:IS110 family transposase [Caballeronia sp. LZ035]MDR5763279.1 IS110 family transposase [Caballeronia sp. LZ035]
MDEIRLVGVDIGKFVFQIHCQDSKGNTVIRKRMSRTQFLDYFASAEPCCIAMEACAGSHFLARRLKEFGHLPRLIAPQFVRPFLKSSKSDMNDAEAICEAAARPSMRFVSAKSEAQQVLCALQRVRQSLVMERCRTASQAHAFLLEFGFAFSRGARLWSSLAEAMKQHKLPQDISPLLEGLASQYNMKTTEIGVIEREMLSRLRKEEAGRRLLTIPGIGMVTACALLCELGDGQQFSNGRQFAASIGLTPRQHSTGGNTRLLGITKRGDKHVRTLLILCAHLIIARPSRGGDVLGDWARALAMRRHPSVAACALANHLARIAWALVVRHTEYEPRTFERGSKHCHA